MTCKEKEICTLICMLTKEHEHLDNYIALSLCIIKRNIKRKVDGYHLFGNSFNNNSFNNSFIKFLLPGWGIGPVVCIHTPQRMVLWFKPSHPRWNFQFSYIFYRLV